MDKEMQKDLNPWFNFHGEVAHEDYFVPTHAVRSAALPVHYRKLIQLFEAIVEGSLDREKEEYIFSDDNERAIEWSERDRLELVFSGN